MFIALFIMFGYLFTGELTLADLGNEPLSGKSLLFYGTTLIVVLYGFNLLYQYNYVEYKDGNLIRHYIFPKRVKKYDLNTLESWIPVSIINGRVSVNTMECSQVELNFEEGGSVKLTDDRYNDLDVLLSILREKYGTKFIDVLADEEQEQKGGKDQSE